MQRLSKENSVSPVRYRRLPGLGVRWFRLVRLYLGPDHLLQVTATCYSETYKRFFFGDIQVLGLHRTVRGAIGDVIWAALLAVFLSLTLTGAEAWPVWAVAAAGAAAILVRNQIVGATCACYVQTAVQQQRLYSLSRLRRARKVLGQIGSVIKAAQTAPEVPASPSAFPPPGGEATS